MLTHPGELLVNLRRCRILLVVLLAMQAAAPVAWAQQDQPQPQLAPSQQDTQPPPPPASSPAPPPAPERGNPGLVEEIGKLLKGSAESLGSALPSPGQALDGLNSSARDATDSLKRIAPLSGQTVATGRTLCPAAANGAPDCKLAADQLCKASGYAEGRSVDIESSQKCSAKAYFAGQGACRTENFVTRAVCQ